VPATFDESGRTRAPGGALPSLPPGLDPRGRRRHSASAASAGSGWHWARFGAKFLSAALSALLLIAFGTYWWKYHAFSSGLNRLDIFSNNATTKPTQDIDGKDQNLLIVGNDDRSTATDAELKQLGTGRDGGSLNTDTMMIVHVPANGAKATLISLPRDSYVNIPGYGMNKLNAAYPDAYNAASGSAAAKRAAGAKLLVQTVQDLTGLTMDHFVQVDLLGFYRISNAIGGVTVNMCAAVKEPDSGIDLHKGINVIKGTQALAFVRQRYNFPNGLGDLDRVERQRYFLTATFRKLTSAGTLLNPIKLQSLLTAVQSSLYMDAGLNPLNLARQMENLSADNIVGQTMPTDGFGTSSNGQSILVVNPAEVKTFVNKLIGTGNSKLNSAKTVAASSVSVMVVNGGNTNGAAAQNATMLTQQGFHATVSQQSATSTATVIQYKAGMESQAKTLAAYVPGATMQNVASINQLTLVLGADGLSAKAKAKATTSSPATASRTATPTPKATAKAPAIDSGCIN
jgi:LCP family protein required for cell wall assembly